MRPEWRWMLVAAAALAVGMSCAEPYARLAVPYYVTVARQIARLYPWTIDELVVAPDTRSPGAVLQLTGEVSRQRGDATPAARVVSRTQVGEAIETPIVFWSLLLAWPSATVRQRLLRLAVGIPVFLSLEAVTTVAQLVHSLADASAMLAGDDDPLTVWERWSRFLENGGRFVLETAAALLTIAATHDGGYNLELSWGTIRTIVLQSSYRNKKV